MLHILLFLYSPSLCERSEKAAELAPQFHICKVGNTFMPEHFTIFLRGGGVFFLTKSNAASDTTVREKSFGFISADLALSLSFLFTSLITLSARLHLFLF